MPNTTFSIEIISSGQVFIQAGRDLIKVSLGKYGRSILCDRDYSCTNPPYEHLLNL